MSIAALRGWTSDQRSVVFPIIGWHGMFMVGVMPALLVLYIRRRVEESPSWDLPPPRATH